MKQILMALVLGCGWLTVAVAEEPTSQKPAAGELMKAGMAKAKAEKKQVFLIFGSPTCGWCKYFEKYHADAEVEKLLGKHLVMVKVDIVENAGGDELYKKYGAQRGVPAFVILDADAKALADSGDGDANIGFPYAPDEVAHYFAALKKAGLKLSDAELALLDRKLVEVKPRETAVEAAPVAEAAKAADSGIAATKAKRPDIYDGKADGAKQIAEALALAKKENKRVILQFGANWCGWCHLLHKLFETDKAIAEKLKTSYVVVLVDVNEGHNKETDEKYGNPSRLGLPAIAILDAEGKKLTTKDSAELEEGDHHDPAKVLAFLSEWAPKK